MVTFNQTISFIKPLLDMEGEFLFGRSEPLSSSTVKRQMQDTIKKSGVKRIRVHDLRHSHVSLLLNNGANIVAVSRKLGHSDVQVTLRTYAHLLPETEDKLVNILDELYDFCMTSQNKTP